VGCSQSGFVPGFRSPKPKRRRESQDDDEDDEEEVVQDGEAEQSDARDVDNQILNLEPKDSN